MQLTIYYSDVAFTRNLRHSSCTASASKPPKLTAIDFEITPDAPKTVSCQRRKSQLHLSCMIRKLKSGEFRLYSRKKDAKTGKRKNLGTFSSLAAAKKHEKAVQYFKRAG
jgi:putative cell wall-binding protein